MGVGRQPGLDSDLIRRNTREDNTVTADNKRSTHPYFMYDAIHGQPDAINRVLDEEAAGVRRLASRLEASKRIHIVGIGTSWHASLVGEHMLRTVAGRDDARTWNAFEFWANPPRLDSDDAVIVMSHRGSKRYSAHALQIARAAGAATGLITGLDSSATSDVADVILRTSPQEQSSAFTISHTTAMTLLAMLARELGTDDDFAAALDNLPDLVRSALKLEDDVRRWAQQAKGYERFYFVGWGGNVSTAYEIPLKLKETCYVVTEGYELEHYLHGIFSATEPECLVTFIAPPGKEQERAADIIAAAKEVRAGTASLVEEGDELIAPLVDKAISLPRTPQALTPIVYLAPLQLFTYWLTLELERDPDVFRQDDPRYRAARQRFEL